ncbi:TPA: phage portal protein family protein [Vibrio harveyi]
MKNPNLRISTLSTALPSTTSNYLTQYYPVPSQLGGSVHHSYDAYWGAIEAMLLDDEVSGDLELRKTVALSMPWVWSGTDVAIDNAKMLLSSIDFDGLLMAGLKHLEYGFNPVELEWLQDTDKVYPIGFSHRAPRQFRIGQQGELIFMHGDFESMTVQPGQVMVFLRNASKEKPYGESLLESVWPTWQVKWNHIANLDRLGEKYAVPSVVALAENGANQDSLNTISYNLAELEGGAGVALGGVKSLHELTISGKATELVDVIKFYDNKICKRITGQTLSTGNQDYGSRALGEVFERATLRITASDLKVVINTINLTLIRWLRLLNPGLEVASMLFDDEAFKAMVEGAKPSANKDPLSLSDSPREELMLCL